MDYNDFYAIYMQFIFRWKLVSVCLKTFRAVDISKYHGVRSWNKILEFYLLVNYLGILHLFAFSTSYQQCINPLNTIFHSQGISSHTHLILLPSCPTRLSFLLLASLYLETFLQQNSTINWNTPDWSSGKPLNKIWIRWQFN